MLLSSWRLQPCRIGAVRVNGPGFCSGCSLHVCPALTLRRMKSAEDEGSSYISIGAQRHSCAPQRCSCTLKTWAASRFESWLGRFVLRLEPPHTHTHKDRCWFRTASEQQLDAVFLVFSRIRRQGPRFSVSHRSYFLKLSLHFQLEATVVEMQDPKTGVKGSEQKLNVTTIPHVIAGEAHKHPKEHQGLGVLTYRTGPEEVNRSISQVQVQPFLFAMKTNHKSLKWHVSFFYKWTEKASGFSFLSVRVWALKGFTSVQCTHYLTQSLKTNRNEIRKCSDFISDSPLCRKEE